VLANAVLSKPSIVKALRAHCKAKFGLKGLDLSEDLKQHLADEDSPVPKSSGGSPAASPPGKEPVEGKPKTAVEPAENVSSVVRRLPVAMAMQSSFSRKGRGPLVILKTVVWKYELIICNA